jgi:hypothetical protein
MNAYELADFIEISNPNDNVHQMIATMLRQLQDDLSDLQRHIPNESFDRTASHMAGEYVSYNEPVAWIDPRELDMTVSTSVTKHKQFDTDIPLYAKPEKYCPSEDNAAYEKGFVDGMGQMIESAVHRAVEGMSAKTLTDEEILQEAYYILMREQQRKAQEK